MNFELRASIQEMRERVVATLVLYNDKKQILLQHRSEDAPRWPGYWALFGGGVEGNETVEEALRRELLEEIGYEVKNPRIFATEESVSEDGLLIKGNIFVEKYDASQPLIIGDGGQGFGWFTLEEALQLKITDIRRKGLLKMQKRADELFI